MTHHWEALGWTLIHFCWQAAAIALVYKLADLAMAKSRTNARYLLALVALLSMLGASIGTLAYEEALHRQTTFASHGGSAATPTVQIIPRPLAVIDMPAGPRQTVQFLSSDVMPYLDAFWLVGVVCLSLRTIGGWWLIRRLRHSALQKAPHTLRIGLDRIRLQMGIPRFVDLRLSNRIAGPLTVGVIRPLILLPITALTSLSPEQLEVVLAHELAHIRRADYFWNILQTMIETLFFFHPAVWWIGGKLRQERELCCDDMAVQLCSDPLVYATALLRLEEQRSQRLSLVMALDGNRPLSGLRLRIARVLGDTSAEQERREVAPLPFVAVCAALLLVMFSVPQLFAGLPGKKQETTAVVVTAPATGIVAATVAAPVVATAHVVPRAVINSTVAAIARTTTTANAETATVDAEGAGLGIGSGSGYGTGASSGEGVSHSDGAGQQEPAHKADYIDRMRAAGYDVDIDKYVAMKVQGVTPEYARDMEKAGFGKPSADDLIALKVQGVTPEYVAGLRSAGLAPTSIGDLVSYRIFQVTPEFVSGMKSAGFDAIPPHKLVELRVHGVTPEYAKMVKQQYPSATIDQLVQLRVFHIDDAFIAAAKRHGFTSLSIDKLVQLRISGVMSDDEPEAK